MGARQRRGHPLRRRPPHRRLTDSRDRLTHIVEVLAASDPRHRGWVLATDTAGKVVRSVRGLERGDRLMLSFHDGAAGAVIDTVPNKEET